MRKNEGIRDIQHLLNVVVRAHFVTRCSRLLIMQHRAEKKSFCVGLEENTEEHIQKDTTKKVLITLTKRQNKQKCREKRGRSEWLVYEEN